ncbi:MAG: ribosome silencing factor [Opitutales bacterium]|nr:ribosome silencing factor [Opitutales bacterium]
MEDDQNLLDTIKACRDALDDKKAIDLKVLDVRGKSPITNYFILATANSEPHLRALSSALDEVLKDRGVKSVGRDYAAGSGWVVVDAFDFMAHIFLAEQRGMYKLEALWKDAKALEL